MAIRFAHSVPEEVRQHCLRTLQDPRSWPFVPPVHIRYWSPEKIRRKLGKKWSTWNVTHKVPHVVPQIILNEWRWREGPDQPCDLEQYRSYVINHEMGHALGLLHPQPPFRRPSVMNPQSETFGKWGLVVWPTSRDLLDQKNT